jgi:hypothetical protein
VAVGVAFGVVSAGVGLRVGVGVGFGDRLTERVGPDVAGALVDGLALVELLGVAAGEPAGLAGTTGDSSVSHDVLLAVAAVLAAAVPVAMTRVAPEAAVARTVPAISVTVAGRACAKRMKRPTCASRYCCGTTRSVLGLVSCAVRPKDRNLSPIGHQVRAERYPSYPGSAGIDHGTPT